MTRALPIVVAMLALPLGCAKLPNPLDKIKSATRVGLAAGSHAHAYQSYAFIYNFANGNANTHQQAIARIQQHGVPLLRELVDAGAVPRLVVETEPSDYGNLTYAIHLDVKTKGGTVRLPGKQGTDPGVYAAAVAKISKATGVPTTAIEQGHGAWYHLTMVLTGLDVEATALQKHTFALQVMQEQVLQGEQADWFDAGRPASETVEDTNHAMALLIDDVGRVRAEQASVLATLALANHAQVPGALEATEEELTASAADLTEWRATHRQPTPDDFGVTYQIPTPQTVQAAVQDELGYVGAALDVARGVATGNLPRTLNGLAGLAPKDTKVKAVATGLAAASKGDIQGTLGAIADLGGPDTKVGRVAARLEAVSGVLQLVK